MKNIIIAILVSASCGGAPTQPTNATALIVQDFQGPGLSLVGGVCVGGVGRTGTCSVNGRLRNVGAGCAQSISVTVTIDGMVYTSPVTVAGSVTRPNEVVPFQIQIQIIEVSYYAGRSAMQIGATWTDIPCEAR